MCGLTFMAGPVPGNVQREAVAGAAARGPHSSGWAGWSGAHGWQVERSLGRLGRLPVEPWPFEVVVGHSRLATASCKPGDAPDAAEGQPLAIGDYLVAHNGTLSPDELERMADWHGCVDSGALLAGLIAGTPCGASLRHTAAPQAVLWSDGAAVYAGRYDGDDQPAHPLYRASGHDWCAVSSGPLPAGRLLPAGETHQLWRLP